MIDKIAERRFRETEAEWVERFESLEAEVERLRGDRTVEWTRTQPTETECWYWTKRPEDVIGIVRYVEAGPNDGDLLVRNLGPCHAADSGIGCNERHAYWQDEIEWWAGPIPEPIGRPTAHRVPA
jgi:hypothetical protein